MSSAKTFVGTAVLAFVVILLATVALSEAAYWLGNADDPNDPNGLWSRADNWDPNWVPGVYDYAIIDNGGQAFFVCGQSETSEVTLGYETRGDHRLTIMGGTFSPTGFVVGDATKGTVTQTGGDVECWSLVLGEDPWTLAYDYGGEGYYSMSGGTIYVFGEDSSQVKGRLVVGMQGRGAFTQTGGTVEVVPDETDGLILAWSTPIYIKDVSSRSDGTYYLSQADPNNPSTLKAGSVTVGFGQQLDDYPPVEYMHAKGVFGHSSGASLLKRDLWVGYCVNSEGEYYLGGMDPNNAPTLTARDEYVAAGALSCTTTYDPAIGTFVQTSGRNLIGVADYTDPNSPADPNSPDWGNLYVGYSKDARGWYEIRGGTLTGTDLHVGFNGYDPNHYGFGSFEIAEHNPNEPNVPINMTLRRTFSLGPNSRFVTDPNIAPTITMDLLRTGPTNTSWEGAFINMSTLPLLSDPNDPNRVVDLDDPNLPGVPGLANLTLVCQFAHNTGCQGSDPNMTFEVAGEDMGPFAAGFVADNFMLHKLVIGRDPNDASLDPNAGGMELTFVDEFDNQEDGQQTYEALYVDYLAIGAGVYVTPGQLDNKIKVYYRNGDPNVKLLIPGDANLDGCVDVGDLGILGAHYGMTGTTWATGDFNGDRIVDIGDLAILGYYYSRTSDPPGGGSNRPEAPTDLTAEDNEECIDLTWSGGSQDLDGFEVWRADDQNGQPLALTWQLIATTAEESYSDEVGYQKTYHYQIVAYNEYGRSDGSEVVCGSTEDRLPAPSNVTAEDGGEWWFLSWTNGGEYLGIEIWRADDDGFGAPDEESWHIVDDGDGAKTSYEDLAGSGVYWYSLCGYDEIGYSDFTDPVTDGGEQMRQSMEPVEDDEQDALPPLGDLNDDGIFDIQDVRIYLILYHQMKERRAG